MRNLFWIVLTLALAGCGGEPDPEPAATPGVAATESPAPDPDADLTGPAFKIDVAQLPCVMPPDLDRRSCAIELEGGGGARVEAGKYFPKSQPGSLYPALKITDWSLDGEPAWTLGHTGKIMRYTRDEYCQEKGVRDGFVRCVDFVEETRAYDGDAGAYADDLRETLRRFQIPFTEEPATTPAG